MLPRSMLGLSTYIRGIRRRLLGVAVTASPYDSDRPSPRGHQEIDNKRLALGHGGAFPSVVH